MKVAPVVIEQGTKEIGENVLILSLKESKHLVNAMGVLAAQNKRNKGIQTLWKQLERELPVSP